MKSLPFFLIFLIPALVLVLLLCSCQKNPNRPENTTDKPEDLSTESLRLISFSFSHNGMPSDDCYGYTVTQTDDGVRLEAQLNAGSVTVDTLISEPVLEQLGELAGRLQLDKWNGFSKTNRLAQDGESFSLSMTLEDGSTVYANGNNSFPNSYFDAVSGINDILKPLAVEYGGLYPKTLESDDLCTIILYLVCKDPYGEFFVRSYIQSDDGRVNLEISLKNYPGFEDFGEFNFYGVCDSFPFEELQTIVRQYELPTWNGWDKAAENYNECEWFQMGLGYDSDEYIEAMGTLHPEHYDEAKTAMLELLGGFIRENKDSFVS